MSSLMSGPEPSSSNTTNNPRDLGRTRMAKKNFIAKALGVSKKHPNGAHAGALTAAVGGPPGQNLGKTEKIARGGGVAARRAQFYLNVLRPGSARSTAARAAKGGK